MAWKASVVITEDRFDMYERRLSRGVQEEKRRAAEAVRRRAKQYIIAWNAIITGDLYRSVGIEMVGDGGVVVFASMLYASYVHDGTEHMEARPFLAQAIADQAPETEARLERVLDRDYV